MEAATAQPDVSSPEHSQRAPDRTPSTARSHRQRQGQLRERDFSLRGAPAESSADHPLPRQAGAVSGSTAGRGPEAVGDPTLGWGRELTTLGV